MSCTDVLKVRVTPELKRQAQGIAARELLAESAWLKRLVLREIGLRTTLILPTATLAGQAACTEKERLAKCQWLSPADLRAPSGRRPAVD